MLGLTFWRFYASINVLIIKAIELDEIPMILALSRQESKMIDKKKKAQIIKKFATHEKDTGSSEVQIALLTEEIKSLTEHLKIHKKDFSSRRGLLRKVAERRKLLKYLEKENNESFKDLVEKLKLKIVKKFDDTPKLLDDDIDIPIGIEEEGV